MNDVPLQPAVSALSREIDLEADLQKRLSRKIGASCAAGEFIAALEYRSQFDDSVYRLQEIAKGIRILRACSDASAS